MPYIARRRWPSRIAGHFGNDYPTEDGTGVRDYIHVMDSPMATSRPWKTG